ncbi:hypothetical protein BC941DRAFT_6754 [Chlamydoabsidia padenii]|nr:hypothetical protein BC941DRAFT_6754 [Chlamydoabsidia padenii]
MLKLMNGLINNNNNSDISRVDEDSILTATTSQPITRYEAEDLNNMVYGLARRRGCLSCSGGAQVIALGKVNHPQTGALRFRNIKLIRPGKYKLTIGYLNCYSWTTCGDKWTRRWNLGISVKNSLQMDPWNHLTIALKKRGKAEETGLFTLGMMLQTEGLLDITLDNPHGYGPSIDYIELEWIDEQQIGNGQNKSYLYLLPFWQSGDPLASENTAFARTLVDYFWEWIAVTVLLTTIGYGIYVLYKYFNGRKHKYMAVLSSNSDDIISLEGMP